MTWMTQTRLYRRRQARAIEAAILRELQRWDGVPEVVKVAHMLAPVLRRRVTTAMARHKKVEIERAVSTISAK